MALPDPASWSDVLRRTLARYEEKLLRLVATRLVKPRNQWPAADLIDRILLIRPGRAEAVVAELQKMGHTPQVSK